MDSTSNKDAGGVIKRRWKEQADNKAESGLLKSGKNDKYAEKMAGSWRRILLLVVAITVHNIPGNFSLNQLNAYKENRSYLLCFGSEGLAVGFGFGAVGINFTILFFKLGKYLPNILCDRKVCRGHVGKSKV